MEVVLDRARAYEETCADLGVREAVADQARDLDLSLGELAHTGGPVLSGFTGCKNLAVCALGEGLRTGGCEQLVGRV